MWNFYAEKQKVLDSLPFFSTKIKRRKKISKKEKPNFFLLACCLGLPLHSRAPRPGHADALVRSVELQDMRQLATRNTPNSILSKPVSFILTKCIRCIGFKASFSLSLIQRKNQLEELQHSIFNLSQSLVGKEKTSPYYI